MNLDGFRILLHFFRTSWGVGVRNSGIFNSFHNRVEFGTILEGLRNFGRGGSNTPTPPGTPLLVPRTKMLPILLNGMVLSQKCTALFFFIYYNFTHKLRVWKQANITSCSAQQATPIILRMSLRNEEKHKPPPRK